MWRIGGVVAVLLFLGLTAAGFVSAQRIAIVSSSSATSSSPAARARAAAADLPSISVNPASKGFQDAIDGDRSAEPSRSAAPRTATPGIGDTTKADAPVEDKSTDQPMAIPPCDKPGGMGLSRIVQVDTTGGPGFGRENFKQYDFLRDKEVVLTFDDGPWPSTPAVLKALTDACLKATFFEIGEHATLHPEITKEVLDAGMTVGTHTWSHKDLARKPYAKDRAKTEIEMGISAVQMAAGDKKLAPFFRFPYLLQSPQTLSYLAERNIAIFSTDIDSRDFKLHKPEDVIKSVMTQLEKQGKGIILMHDFHRNTAEALPELIRRLKDGGYKVVHMVPKGELTTLPKYDDMVRQKFKLSSDNTRLESSVVRTFGVNR
jgi:peptidoglycan/xylan/chitin deacetylase (PgdA/CDA1 family)